jgi:mono/diheme cytochrome c family protein
MNYSNKPLALMSWPPWTRTRYAARRRTIQSWLSCGLTLLLSFSSGGSVKANDWPTFGHDPRRSGWAEENILSPENVGSLELKWTRQVENVPLALNSLTAPLVASKVITSEGIKTVVYVAGSSDTFFALDAEDGKILWSRTFDSAAQPDSESFYLCPNAVNATPTIDQNRNIVYSLARDGKLYGLDLGSGATKFGPFQFVPAFAKAWSLNFYNGVVYTSTSQGCGGDRSGIYSMDVTDAMHTISHELLIRRGNGGGMWGRGGVVIGVNHLLYTSTGDGNFDPTAGDYGSSFLSITLGDLRLLDYYTPLNWKDINKHDLDLPSGGLVAFSYKHHALIAGGGKESVLYLMRGESLGGKDHHTALYLTSALANDDKELEQKGMWGAPAVWTDSKDKETWLYVTIWGPLSKNAPSFPVANGEVPHGCIMAFNVVDDKKTRNPILQPAWISPDFNLPDPPVVANGVLFVLATGENPQQQHVQGLLHYKGVEDWKNNLLTTEQRGLGTRPAVLHALDAKTGRLLYQSGSAMKTWVHFSGLAVGDGRVYAVDHDSRIYCFGLKDTAIKEVFVPVGIAPKPPLTDPKVANSAADKWQAPPGASSQTNPETANPSAVAVGRKLFTQACAGCHAEDGSSQKSIGANLRSPETQAQSDGALFWKITHGNTANGMPSFSYLSESVRWDIVTFLRTLKKSNDNSSESTGKPNKVTRNTECPHALCLPRFEELRFSDLA